MAKCLILNKRADYHKKSFCRNKAALNRIKSTEVYNHVSKKEHTEQSAMLKLAFCIIVLTAVCSAQEHLTCLRTDDVLNRQNQQHSQRALQGSPGKRSPRGHVGARTRKENLEFLMISKSSCSEINWIPSLRKWKL